MANDMWDYIKENNDIPDWANKVVQNYSLEEDSDNPYYEHQTIDDITVIESFEEFLEYTLNIDSAELFSKPDDYAGLLKEFIENNLSDGTWREGYDDNPY